MSSRMIQELTNLRLRVSITEGFESRPALRLVPLGQTEGQRILAGLMPVCIELAAEATEAGPDDLGGCAILSDIASMRHETQDVRLFRS